ncbi:MAG: PTS sugar transporter subunit IIA [Elusimicrobiota bacterium]|nr:PTS sugar transporter subunit IIA [Elusimicrobiota bacterium]
MKIKDFVSKDSIELNLKEETKKEHMAEMVGLLVDAGVVKEKASGKIIKELLKREEMGSTGIGGGIAIPHIKTDEVSSVAGAIGISKKGIDFDALDGEPVYVSFLLLTPTGAPNEHLKALSEISAFLKDDITIKDLKELESSRKAYKFIKKI